MLERVKFVKHYSTSIKSKHKNDSDKCSAIHQLNEPLQEGDSSRNKKEMKKKGGYVTTFAMTAERCELLHTVTNKEARSSASVLRPRRVTVIQLAAGSGGDKTDNYEILRLLNGSVFYNLCRAGSVPLILAPATPTEQTLPR